LESLAEAKRVIHDEIMAADKEAQKSFLERYAREADRFADLMAVATLAWQEFAASAKHDKAGFVAHIAYCAVSLHIQSTKLLLLGHIVAAGNLSRQVVEAIATALLCSGKGLPVLDSFVEDRYSTSHAVQHLRKNREALGLREDGMKALADAEEFYHLYSHLTKMTVASLSPMNREGVYVGAAFDEAKIDSYDKEIEMRLGLAEVFPNFITALTENIGKW
jgi:hypothetical protein